MMHLKKCLYACSTLFLMLTTLHSMEWNEEIYSSKCNQKEKILQLTFKAYEEDQSASFFSSSANQKWCREVFLHTCTRLTTMYYRAYADMHLGLLRINNISIFTTTLVDCFAFIARLNTIIHKEIHKPSLGCALFHKNDTNWYIKLAKELNLINNSNIDTSNIFNPHNIHKESYLRSKEQSRSLDDISFEIHVALKALQVQLLNMTKECTMPKRKSFFFKTYITCQSLIKNMSEVIPPPNIIGRLSHYATRENIQELQNL